MRFFTRLFSAVVCLFFLFLLLSQGQMIAESVFQGIHLCLESIIPSLFCFMVLVNFLIFSGLYHMLSLPFSPLTKMLFYLPPQVGSVILLSFLGGYPAGAIAIRSLLLQEIISPKQARRMLSFCCCAGPSFIVTAIGSRMFGSSSLGIMLLFAQIGASILMGFFTGIFFRISCPESFSRKSPFLKSSPSLSVSFVSAVEQSVSTCGKMCGFIVLFHAVTEMLSSALGKLPFAPFLLGLLEVTNGCRMASSMPLGIFSACFFLSFGGVCVLSQISGILKDTPIPMNSFVLSRIIHGLLSCVLLWLELKASPDTLNVFSSVCHPVPLGSSATPLLSLCLMMMSLLLILRTKEIAEK